MVLIVRTKKEWEFAIRQQGLHLKHDTQLIFNQEQLEDKLVRIDSDLRFEEDFKEGHICMAILNSPKRAMTREEATECVESDIANKKKKVAMIRERLACLDQEIINRADELVVRTPKGTPYFVDFTNGHDVNNDGTTAVKSNGDGPWATLDKATATLIAGDTVTVRGSMTQVVTQDLNFTNDGTILLPILMERDYDNNWGDRVDLSVTATATLTFGSKTVTYSVAINGVLAAGDWIYVSGDDNRLYAYEVASIAGDNVTVTLYLPYKGGQAGAGRTTYNMGDNPIWNTAAGDFQVNLDTDHFWKFQSLHFRGTDAIGVFEYDSVIWAEWRDCIFEGNGVGDVGIRNAADDYSGIIKRCRTYNVVVGIYAGGGTLDKMPLYDCLFDENNVLNSYGIGVVGHQGTIHAYDCEFKNNTLGDIYTYTTAGLEGQIYMLRNCLLSSAIEFSNFSAAAAIASKAYLEDYDQTEGDNRQIMAIAGVNDTTVLQSETTKVRPSGGSTSAKITPVANMSPNCELGKVLIWEHKINADTNSKTYTVYFLEDDHTDWTANPTALELWVEAEYWGHATNPARKLTKSTGTVDFINGDDATWHTITVTAQPAQAGVLYLRVYYCKTKEAGNANVFYCDTREGIA
ncbi:MAG: hypothetical protein A2Y91_03425 [Chloroflexi bacterium RBG_13_54_8]|nr:MAG: hypothetical protein A2Y91_03425 [Chloroflexi bacterium RBG_13_54_8]